VPLAPIVSAGGHVENFLADDANRGIRYSRHHHAESVADLEA
jgi:hypothetical protein